MAPHAEPGTVQIKRHPEDFKVVERLGIDFQGSGEHAYFRVRKTNLNTTDVARELAAALGLKPFEIGYAGRKDRRAVTEQWFSAPTPSDRWPLDLPGVQCLEVQRHHRKLRRAEHDTNYFELVLRGVPEQLIPALRQLDEGFPNAFGVQRVSSSNIQQAKAHFDRQRVHKPGAGKRRPRRGASSAAGWHMSVARSYLFNEVLNARIANGSWRRPVPGEVLLDGMPSGPLWGRGRSPAEGEAAEIELQALAPHETLCAALEFSGLQQQRRALVAVPAGLSVQVPGDGVVNMAFELAPGAYATSMLSHAATVVEEYDHGS